MLGASACTGSTAHPGTDRIRAAYPAQMKIKYKVMRSRYALATYPETPGTPIASTATVTPLWHRRHEQR